MLGKESKYANECYAEKFIGTWYDADEDLSNYLYDDKNEFYRIYKPIYIAKNPKKKESADSDCEQIWTICKGIKKDDIVICPDSKNIKKYYVGKVINDYEYVSVRFKNGEIQPHRRQVEWFYEIDKKEIPKDLLEDFKRSKTVKAINNGKHIENIKKLIRGEKIITQQKKINKKKEQIIKDDYFFIINKAFRIILPHLAEFVCSSLKERDNKNWRQRCAMVQNFPQKGSYEECVYSLDIQGCLNIIEKNWLDVFGSKLKINLRTWARELKDIRNDIDAHYNTQTIKSLNEEDVERALDTMVRFMDPINKGIAEEIRSIKNNIKFEKQSKNH